VKSETEMSVAADDPWPPKRRRLNNIDHRLIHSQTQLVPTAPHRQTYIPLADSREEIPKPERYNHDEPRSANGTCLFGSLASYPSPEILSKIEQEESECCYGMVGRS
jgi:hypothetical protein